MPELRPDWLPAGRDPLLTHRLDDWWVDLLTRDEKPLGRLRGCKGGQVEQNVNRPITGGGSLEVRDVGQGVDWLDARVRVWWSVAGVDPWPVGTFVCSAPTAAHTATGRSWSVEILDKNHILSEDAVPAAYTVAAGANVAAAVRAVIASAGEPATAITDSPETLANAMVWPAGTSKLTIVNDLLDAINYFAIRCDGWGTYTAGPYQAPAQRPVVRDFVRGRDAVHLPTFTVDEDTTVPNRVILTTTGSGTEEALVSVASNMDPTSRYSYPSRGRWITHTEEVEATSQQVLDDLAIRKLDARSVVSKTIEITNAPVPLSVNDVVRFTSGPEDVVAATQAFTQALAVGATMKTTIRQVTA